MIQKEKDGIVYFEFEHLAKTDLVNHCFSSRIGGVSQPPYDSMNLAYHMGDNKKDVDENFKRMSKVVRFDQQNIIMTDQVHGASYHVVTDLTQPKKTDALLTEFPGLVLTSYYADCVPVLFLDPIKQVIANVHAGWRGVAADVTGETLGAMSRNFGCQLADILVGIGPAISKMHFEVGIDAIEVLGRRFQLSEPHVTQKSAQKWHVDLKGMLYEQFLKTGVPAENIEVSDLCTFEHPELFYSHRRDGKARGNMAAMIALK